MFARKEAFKLQLFSRCYLLPPTDGKAIEKRKKSLYINYRRNNLEREFILIKNLLCIFITGGKKA
jgi:hypothetical protein